MIPSAELNGLLLMRKLILSFVVKSLKPICMFNRIYIWKDSRAAFFWVKDENKIHKHYVFKKG